MEKEKIDNKFTSRNVEKLRKQKKSLYLSRIGTSSSWFSVYRYTDFMFTDRTWNEISFEYTISCLRYLCWYRLSRWTCVSCNSIRLNGGQTMKEVKGRFGLTLCFFCEFFFSFQVDINVRSAYKRHELLISTFLN